jgi:hypothetical protein
VWQGLPVVPSTFREQVQLVLGLAERQPCSTIATRHLEILELVNGSHVAAGIGRTATAALLRVKSLLDVRERLERLFLCARFELNANPTGGRTVGKLHWGAPWWSPKSRAQNEGAQINSR